MIKLSEIKQLLDASNGLCEASGRAGGWIGPVYHGSMFKGLKKIDPSYAGTGIVSGASSSRIPMTWFTSSKENASFYADVKEEDEEGEYIYRCYIKMQNPMVVTEDEFKYLRQGPKSLAIEARKKGHDGIILRDIIDGHTSSNIYAVFHPGQIKVVGQITPSPHKELASVQNEASDIELIRGITYYYEIEDFIREESFGKVFAFSDDEKIGELSFSIYQDVGHIKMVYVKDDFRRRGIATEMIRKLKSICPKGIKPGYAISKAGEELSKKNIGVNSKQEIQPKPFSDKEWEAVIKRLKTLKKDTKAWKDLYDLADKMNDWDNGVDDMKPEDVSKRPDISSILK